MFRLCADSESNVQNAVSFLDNLVKVGMLAMCVECLCSVALCRRGYWTAASPTCRQSSKGEACGTCACPGTLGCRQPQLLVLTPSFLPAPSTAFPATCQLGRSWVYADRFLLPRCQHDVIPKLRSLTTHVRKHCSHASNP